MSNQDFEKCITHKYEPTIMSRLQWPTLKLRHEANQFFFNCFIRLQQQNIFKNLIRFPSIRFHLTTRLNTKLYSHDEHRPNLRNTSAGDDTDSYRMPLYNNILHPDMHLQGPLRQVDSMWTIISPEVGSASPDSGKPGSKHFSLRQEPLLFRRISGRTFKYPAFLNRAVQKEPRGGIIPDMHLRQGDDYLFFNKSLPGTIANMARFVPYQESKEKTLKRYFSILTHLILQPFRPWPNRLIDKDGLKALRLSGQIAEERLEPLPAFIDKRTRHFVDNASRKNNEISQRMPPKMKLAVSEKKDVPDFKNEFQNLEQQLKKINSAESSPTHSSIDIHQISERVYDEIERKLRIERERRGL